MAEGLARAYATDRGWATEVRSAGVLGLIGRAADPTAVRVMQEVSINISKHQSGAVTPELVLWADHILVMELAHQMVLHKDHPGSEGKVLQLASFGGLSEIKDPYGGWRWRFRTCRDDLRRCVERFMDRLPAQV
jgi:protein-tyrosine-phosphatase